MGAIFKGGLALNNVKRIINWDYSQFLFAPSSLSQNHPLPNVVPDNSIFILEPFFSASLTRPDVSCIGVYVLDAVTLVTERYATQSGLAAAGGGKLIEFNKVKYSKSGILERNGTTFTDIYYDKLVNPNKLFISASITSRYNGSNPGEGIFIGKETGQPNFVRFQHTSHIDKLFYKIIELH